MTVTPDDVVHKQFRHVRFKEGFDPDEVDDFLDEIVVEWRKTIAENDELKARLAGDASVSPVAAPQPVAALPSADVDDEAPAAPAPLTSAQAVATSAGIIELAQRLHDEYVADSQAQHDKLISEARTEASSIVSQAESRSREERARLEKDRASLEERIGELREFESEYRTQLKAILEEKLRDLDVVVDL